MSCRCDGAKSALNGLGDTGASSRALIEGILASRSRPAENAEWGFQNRSDLVTLGTGERVVVQSHRRRADAERRLRTTRSLS